MKLDVKKAGPRPQCTETLDIVHRCGLPAGHKENEHETETDVLRRALVQAKRDLGLIAAYEGSELCMEPIPSIAKQAAARIDTALLLKSDFG